MANSRAAGSDFGGIDFSKLGGGGDLPGEGEEEEEEEEEDDEDDEMPALVGGDDEDKGDEPEAATKKA